MALPPLLPRGPGTAFRQNFAFDKHFRQNLPYPAMQVSIHFNKKNLLVKAFTGKTSLRFRGFVSGNFWNASFFPGSPCTAGRPPSVFFFLLSLPSIRFLPSLQKRGGNLIKRNKFFFLRKSLRFQNALNRCGVIVCSMIPFFSFCLLSSHFFLIFSLTDS